MKRGPECTPHHGPGPGGQDLTARQRPQGSPVGCDASHTKSCLLFMEVGPGITINITHPTVKEHEHVRATSGQGQGACAHTHAV